MKIKVLMTDKAMQRPVMDDRERMLSAAVSPGVEISVDCIRKGPDELDCHTDEAFAAPELVKMAIQAEKDGYDAIVIYCFSDVGLEALRENVKIPGDCTRRGDVICGTDLMQPLCGSHRRRLEYSAHLSAHDA